MIEVALIDLRKDILEALSKAGSDTGRRLDRAAAGFSESQVDELNMRMHAMINGGLVVRIGDGCVTPEMKVWKRHIRSEPTEHLARDVWKDLLNGGFSLAKPRGEFVYQDDPSYNNW